MNNWLKKILVLGAALIFSCLPIFAFAQSIPVGANNLSGSITTSNTFQSIQAGNNGRKGCTVQNVGTTNQYVYFGTITSATNATSVLLTPGNSVNCAVSYGAYILTSQVSISGTAGDIFYANFQ